MARLAALCALCAVVLTTGCTVATYHDPDGRSLLVVDLRLSGSAVNVAVRRPDGTIVLVNRDQGSPEGSISAVAEALQPVRIP